MDFHIIYKVNFISSQPNKIPRGRDRDIKRILLRVVLLKIMVLIIRFI